MDFSVLRSTQPDFRLLPETTDHLSIKTQNTLLRGGIHTAEDIMLASSEDLIRIRGFGPGALNEVAQWRRALMQSNINLFEETLSEVVDAMDATMSIESRRRAMAAMGRIWERISRGPFTATYIRQMLIPPNNDA
jgi:hypothetical protein